MSEVWYHSGVIEWRLIHRRIGLFCFNCLVAQGEQVRRESLIFCLAVQQEFPLCRDQGWETSDNNHFQENTEDIYIRCKRLA